MWVIENVGYKLADHDYYFSSNFNNQCVFHYLIDKYGEKYIGVKWLPPLTASIEKYTFSDLPWNIKIKHFEFILWLIGV